MTTFVTKLIHIIQIYQFVKTKNYEERKCTSQNVLEQTKLVYLKILRMHDMFLFINRMHCKIVFNFALRHI